MSQLLTYVFLFLLVLPIALSIVVILPELRRDRILVLSYHRLLPDQPPQNMDHIGAEENIYCVCENCFRQQMSYLKENGYSTISFEEFLSYQRGRKRLPPNPVILSFDDGYTSVYERAYPILKEYKFSATIFITTDTQSKIFQPFNLLDAPLKSEQLSEMIDSGLISIQSHGVTHRILTRLKPSDLEWELKYSKGYLEAITHKPVNILCAPNGFSNAQVAKTARRVGYSAVIVGGNGTINISSDPFGLRRVVVEKDISPDEFPKLFHRKVICLTRLNGWLKNILADIIGHQRWNDLSRFAIWNSFLRSKFAILVVSGYGLLILGILVLSVLR
jgi:peptidoglycan/xylan/chitin deacetylase (PgdA/CDA1 family)